MARSSLSLRGRAYIAVLTVVLAPVVVVTAARALGAGERERMERRVASAARDARAALTTPPDAAALDAIAAREGVRVRVVDGAGDVVIDVDHEPAASLRDRVGDLFFGPEGAPSLRAHDEARPPLAARPEIAAARRSPEGDRGCELAMNGRLLVCHAALAAAPPGGAPAVVIAEESSPRAIRALWEVRWPMLKLTSFVLLGGLALAWWLGRRIVRPIERLRADVLARTAAPLAGEPVTVSSRDEIGDLGRAFNVLLAAIAERSRQNHAFMADLVHELKSPVAAVRAAAEALGQGPADEARAARLHRVLTESGRRLDAVVSEFLELSRAEAGLPSEERERLDAGALVRGLVDAMRDDERHAGVRFELEAAPAEVVGVAGQIERAVGNVLDNAASFAGPGGAVRVAVRAEEGACVIEVRDTGPGIAPEKLPRVFDRFFTDREGGRGTGLGLALAKAIVEAHGGTIGAASEPARGAALTLRLPLVSHGVHTSPADVSPGG